MDSGDIGGLVEAYGLACAERCGLEDVIRSSDCGTGRSWEAWYAMGLDAICNDDIDTLEEAVRNMNEISGKVLREDSGGQA